MDTIQSNMADRISKNQTSNASIQNVNFKLHLDIYSSQRTPSVSPTSLSDEPGEGLIALIKKEEVPVVFRTSSTSSSVDENLSQLESNVEDKSSGVDVDSDDGSLNDNEIIREIPDCRMQKPGYTTFIKKEAKDTEADSCDSPLVDGASTSLANAKDMVDEVLDDEKIKKKKTRQEVDPSKYIEVVNADGTKYACSMCGNIYAWRKSLNKHWKEKHNNKELLLNVNCSGMVELLREGKYTLVEGRIVYETAFLRELKVTQSDNISLTSHPASLSHSSHHSDVLNKSPSLPSLSGIINELATPHLLFPSNSVAIPKFPVHNMGYDPSEDILDLTCGRNQSSGTSALSGTHHQDEILPSDQAQPLNLSRSSNSVENIAPEKLRKKVISCTTKSVKELPQYSKSNTSFHSETDSPGFITSKMSKKVVPCFECKVKIKSMDVLNKHFMKHHIQMLSDYKKASKKIPHGLQQCYHLLDMNINDVVELSYQNLDRMMFKCKNCGCETKGAADFQKHAMLHAGERPHICMVCGATYKFKWDLVKHFERSHTSIPNPYRRTDMKDTSNGSSEEDGQPLAKKAKSEEGNGKMGSGLCTRNDDVPMEEIFESSLGRKASSCQQNGFDPVMTKKQTVPRVYKNTANIEGTQVEQIALTDPTAPKKDRSSKTHTAKTQPFIPHTREERTHTAKTQPFIPHTREESGSWQTNITKGRDSENLQGLKPEQYKCTDCDLQFCLLSALKKHRITHKQHKPYRCLYCEYRSKWKWDVAKHMKRCSRAGHDGVSQRGSIGEQGRGHMKYTQPIFAGTSQSINENALSFCAEALDGSPKSNSKGMSTKGKSSSYNNAAIVNQNNAAQIYGMQTSTLKQAIEIISKGNASSSSSSPIALGTACRQQNRSSGHISSAEVWKCSHCTFTTHSQAELKQHSSIHSEGKPFKCDQCMYSTNWACDLKKHKKRYNHFKQINDSQEIEEAHEEFQPRFKCSHCTIYFGALQELTDHHIRKHAAKEPNQTSRVTLMEDVVDMARIKHPRKRVKHISCSRCPFMDTSLHVMVAHLIDDIHCCYCKSMFTNKESFFYHLTTHEEFTPKEWELYFMISATEQQLIKDAHKAHRRAKNKTLGQNADAREINQNYSKFKYGYSETSTTGTDPSLFRVQPIVAEKSGHVLDPLKRVQLNLYTCEWCLAEFTNLTAVYHHAQQFHPLQLNEQVADMARTDNASPQMTPHINGMNAKERGCSLTDKYAQKLSTSPDAMDEEMDAMDEEMDAMDEEMDAKKFQTFLGSSATQEQSSGMKQFQCHFCELSVESVNLLQRHMMISHGQEQQVMKLRHTRISSASSSTGILQDCGSFPFTSEAVLDVSYENEMSCSELSSSEMTSNVTSITDFKPIEYSELLKVQMNGLREPLTGIACKNTGANPCNKSVVLKTLSCALCPFKTHTTKMMNGHVVNHMIQSEYQCHSCNFSSHSVAGMNAHSKVHEEGYASGKTR